MVTMFGMSRLGRIFVREGESTSFLPSIFTDGPRECSEQTAREIDLEVRKIIDEATEQVREILRCNRPVLDLVAYRLIEKEVIDGAELMELLRKAGFFPETLTVAVGLNGAPSENGNIHVAPVS